ncbi:hypothetical protein G8V07_12505 [Clostridium botulinum D/C]|uniref:hypothetical protein n=1 Tax=Clostridium botulinum TaxID=1491 RepID=UPI001E52F4A5|nr:hypothetical protein [Clostridium botulinum]MCD3321130.1 hypothetical protein [Clostridium botulinum D/C]MCD3324570.1 hypothetical protein [Clostridium botulinum D/C]MCD3326864.1 hypothetical protein [Clostridium botulinum D/C]
MNNKTDNKLYDPKSMQESFIQERKLKNFIMHHGDEFEKMAQADTEIVMNRFKQQCLLISTIPNEYKDTCLTIAVEELSELQKEVCKLHRRKLRRDNLIEEIADVQIIIEWLKSIVNIHDGEIEDIKQQKIDRIINRYENGEFK